MSMFQQKIHFDMAMFEQPLESYSVHPLDVCETDLERMIIYKIINDEHIYDRNYKQVVQTILTRMEKYNASC